jgi:signal transduction histidine kinase
LFLFETRCHLQSDGVAPGVEIAPLKENLLFRARIHPLRHAYAPEAGLRRVARVFAERPERILQELVDVAVELCGADSAGVSVEEPGAEPPVFRWVATSGRYQIFQNVPIPYTFAPCSVCLERGEPQHFRVGQAFFDLLNVQAEPVTDGMLIPWQVDDIRGTIWIVAHVEAEAFDQRDYEIIQSLADFAAIAVRHQRQQEILIRQMEAAAAAAMANQLAHEINNPLQGLSNILYLMASGTSHLEPAVAAQLAATELRKLSEIVQRLLALSSTASQAIIRDVTI